MHLCQAVSQKHMHLLNSLFTYLFINSPKFYNYIILFTLF